MTAILKYFYARGLVYILTIVLCYSNRHSLVQFINNNIYETNYLVVTYTLVQIYVTDRLKARGLRTHISTVMGPSLLNLQRRFANCHTMRESRQFAKQIENPQSIRREITYLNWY